MTNVVCVGAFVEDSCTKPSPYASADQGQLLIAYLVPDGTTAPASFTSTDLGGLTFTASSIYDSYLTTTTATAPPAGYEWAGYFSSAATVPESSEINVTADFGLPAGADDGLYGGPFDVPKVVIGERDDAFAGGVESTPTAALDCGASDTDCVSDTSTGALSIATRELMATAPTTTVSVQAGSTATVPFTVEYSGPSADPFQLSASTSSDALVATPAAATFTPTGTGNTTEDVSVPVPAGLAPGSYTVTLNVGSFASTPATLNVTAAPAPTTAASTNTATTLTPAVAPAVSPAISGLDITRSLKLTLRLNIAATEQLTLERLRHHRWITLKKLSTRGSAGVNTLHLKGLFGKLLVPAGRYRVTVQATDASTSSGTQSLGFTVR